MGDVLSSIVDNGFRIGGLYTIHLTLAMAEELFDIYRSVMVNFADFIQNICSSPVLAVSVEGSPDVVEEFREFCGPVYPEIAKILRPKSIRAKFGVSPINNAVHCTDLSQDGNLESRYVFETLGRLV